MVKYFPICVTHNGTQYTPIFSPFLSLCFYNLYHPYLISSVLLYPVLPPFPSPYFLHFHHCYPCIYTVSISVFPSFLSPVFPPFLLSYFHHFHHCYPCIYTVSISVFPPFLSLVFPPFPSSYFHHCHHRISSRYLYYAIYVYIMHVSSHFTERKF